MQSLFYLAGDGVPIRYSTQVSFMMKASLWVITHCLTRYRECEARKRSRARNTAHHHFHFLRLVCLFGATLAFATLGFSIPNQRHSKGAGAPLVGTTSNIHKDEASIIAASIPNRRRRSTTTHDRGAIYLLLKFNLILSTHSPAVRPAHPPHLTREFRGSGTASSRAGAAGPPPGPGRSRGRGRPPCPVERVDGGIHGRRADRPTTNADAIEPNPPSSSMHVVLPPPNTQSTLVHVHHTDHIPW